MSSYIDQQQEQQDSHHHRAVPQSQHPDLLSLFRSQSSDNAEFYLTEHLHQQTVGSLPEGAKPGDGMKRIRSLREKIRKMKERKAQQQGASSNNAPSADATTSAQGTSTDTAQQQQDSNNTSGAAPMDLDTTAAAPMELDIKQQSESESDTDEEDPVSSISATHSVLSFHHGSTTSTNTSSAAPSTSTTALLSREESPSTAAPQEEQKFSNDLGFISISTPSNQEDQNTHSDKSSFAKQSWVNDTPWMKKNRNYSSHPTLFLHQEILDFVKLIEETPEERKYREKIINTIQETARELDPTAEFDLYGSFPVNLMIPGSDVDIIMRSKRITSKDKNKSFMFKLKRALQQKDLTRNCQVIANAKVPIMKIQEKHTRHWFDLHVDFDRSKQVDKVVTYVQKQLDKYPALRYLVLIVKYFLKQRNMNDAANGGLSSFGVFLMCLSMLQHHDSAYDDRTRNITSLGHLLLDFFALYGIHFNYDRVAISVSRNGRYLPKTEAATYVTRPTKFQITGPHASRLVILDPLDRTNCVTYITRHIEVIRFSFANAFRLMTSTWKEGESLLNRVIPPDSVLYTRAVGLQDAYKSELDHIYGGSRNKKRKRSKNDHGGHKKKKRSKKNQ